MKHQENMNGYTIRLPGSLFRIW